MGGWGVTNRWFKVVSIVPVSHFRKKYVNYLHRDTGSPMVG
jgi:hypothetical protein